MTTLWATAEDVQRWIDEHRWDILQWVHVFWKGGHAPQNYKDGVPSSADLWISPRTGFEHERCPFVRKDPNRPTYRCTIYDTRPQVCRNYEPWAEGTICEEVK
jgi:Fe-S-cluster containining protein